MMNAHLILFLFSHRFIHLLIFFKIFKNFSTACNYSSACNANKFLRGPSTSCRATVLRARYAGAPVCMRTRISSFLHRRSLAKRLSLPSATDFRQESSPTVERGGRSCTLNPDQFSQVVQPIYRHDLGITRLQPLVHYTRTYTYTLHDYTLQGNALLPNYLILIIMRRVIRITIA